jgi:GNAT superfamily N-acetyltransferase
MGFLEENCKIFPMTDEFVNQCQPFSCGDSDLDDFFANNTGNYERQMLGKSYCCCLIENPSVIVCAFTVSNAGMDVRHLPGSRRKKLIEVFPREKHLSSYPAVLIGRMGVNKEFSGKGIGSELLEIICAWAIDPDNKFACRFLTVDAYNNEATRKFYEANGFICLFTSEQQEKEYIKMPLERELKTRLMYFDLLRIS